MLATLTDLGEEGIGGRTEEEFGGQVHTFIRVFIFLFHKLNPSSPSTCTQATDNACTHAAYTGRLHSGPDTRTLGSLGREDRRGPTDGVPGVVTSPLMRNRLSPSGCCWEALAQSFQVLPCSQRWRPPRPFDQGLLNLVNALGEETLGEYLFREL